MKNLVLFAVTFALDLVAAIALGTSAWVLMLGLDIPWWLAAASGLSVTYLIITLLMVVVPSLQKSAGGSQITAAAMLRNIRQEGAEAEEMQSGGVGRKIRAKLGFAPANGGGKRESKPEEPVAPLVPATPCAQCSGSGASAEDPNFPCPVCRGTGRKPHLWKV